MKTVLAASLIFMAASAPLQDASEEARAQDLMREIRCVACENEPISQSAAPIAEDMRDRVRAMVGEGATDIEVRDWFAGRYGEFVLFRPSGGGLSGWLLWGGPFLLLLLGSAIGLGFARRRGDTQKDVEPEEV
jgi:cytochrome c-type biogenesis protein CcmH